MMKKLLCTLLFIVVSVGVLQAQADINVQGNGNDILDGSVAADVSTTNFTDFGDIIIGSGTVSRTYTIQNVGSVGIFGGLPTVSSTEFTVNAPFPGGFLNLPNNGDSINFTIEFTPSTIGEIFTTVSIGNTVPTETPYDFVIRVNVVADPSSQLLITQYYEGIGPNDNWIEVKNVSNTPASTSLDKRYLALFLDSKGTINGGVESNPPDHFAEIPELLPGQVALFRRAGAASPSPANLGSPAAVEITEVCSFDGDDIIVISTTNDNFTYNSKLDIIGTVGVSSPVVWGRDVSLIKGCGNSEIPSLVYSPSNYITLDLNEVNTANSSTNIALGTQSKGGTEWSGSAWKDGIIPDRTTHVVMNGNYASTNGSFETCDLTIASGVTVNFDSGTTNFIKVHNDLITNGSLVIGDTESLLTTNLGATLGTITKKEVTTTLKQYDFTYWSSPVQGANTSVFGLAPASRIFRWYRPRGTNDTGGWQVHAGTLDSGRGYISEAPDGATSHEVEFTGVPHNDQISTNLGFASGVINGGGGYNLIGNPYPSAINIDLFLDYVNNNHLTGTIWLWTHVTAFQDNDGIDNDYVTDDYATYNFTGGVGAGSGSNSGSPAPTYNIGSGQGFFVNTTSVNNRAFFRNYMRLDNENNQFFKNIEKKKAKDRVWIDLKSKKGGASKQILIGFIEKATDGIDRGYDGLRFTSDRNINFYSLIENKRFAIQGLGTFNSDKTIPLGFDSYIKETLTVSINKLEGVLENENIYLVDNYLNIVHDLKASDYEFDVDQTGSFADRFTLKFNKAVLGVDDVELNNNFIVINQDNTLRVKASETVNNLKVYDILGKLLIDSNPNKSDFNLETNNISIGTVLILNAKLENGITVSKKAIKL